MEVALFIGSSQIDFFKDEVISLSDSIQEIQDISKVFTPFTKQFNVPASSVNNLVFKHYYNYDIDSGNYDARFRSPARLTLNGADFKTGNVQLQGVSMANNKAKSYKIVFYGDTAALNDILAEKELKDLFFLSDYDILINGGFPADALESGYQSNGVVATNTSNRNMIVPVMSTERFYINDPADTTTPNNLHTVSLFELGKDVKFSIKVKRIIESIQSQFDISFNMTDETINGKTYTSFFGSAMFDELYMLLYRKAVKITIPTSLAGDITLYGLNYNFRGVKLSLNDYTIITGGGPDVFSSGKLIVTSEYEYGLRFRFKSQFSSAAGIPMTMQITDKTTGEVLAIIDSKISYTQATGLGTGRLTSGTLSSRTYDLLIELRNETGATVSFSSLNTLLDFGLQVDKFERGTSTLVSQSYYSNSSFNMANWFFVQDNTPIIKIIDFLSALLKQFNLTAFNLAEQGPTKIYIMTFDDYMTLGNNLDITKYVDITKSQISRTIPYSQIDYSYQQPKDNTSIRYLNNVGQPFGSLKYSAPEDYSGRSFGLSVPFSRIVLVNSSEENGSNPTGVLYPWLVTNDQKPVAPSPFLFFNVRKTVASSDAITSSGITEFNMVSNLTESEDHSLSFGNEQPDNGGGLNENGLFNRFYKQYIVSAFELKGRILNITAYLPPSILLQYQLNDIIIISGREYYINKITINLLTRKTQMELLTKINSFTASVLS